MGDGPRETSLTPSKTAERPSLPSSTLPPRPRLPPRPLLPTTNPSLLSTVLSPSSVSEEAGCSSQIPTRLMARIILSICALRYLNSQKVFYKRFLTRKRVAFSKKLHTLLHF